MAIKENTLPVSQTIGSGDYVRKVSSGGISQQIPFDKLVEATITVDPDIDPESTNPVENRAVAEALEDAKEETTQAISDAIDEEVENRNAAISEAIDGEVADRNEAIQSAITDEVTARNQAIAGAIDTEVADRNTAISEAISAEVTNRNEAISEAINTEVTNRNTAISNAIGAEEDARDQAIASAINTEIANRNQAIEDAIDAEVVNRNNAITSAVDAEAQDRAEAIQAEADARSAAIEAEAEAREQADQELKESMANADGYYPDLYAGGLVTDKGETDVSPYTFRASKALGYRESLSQIVGATVGWNQLARLWSNPFTVSGVTFTQGDNGHITASGTGTASYFSFLDNVQIYADHVYLNTSQAIKNPNNVSFDIGALNVYVYAPLGTSKVMRATTSANSSMGIQHATTGADFTGLEFTYNLIDLTSAFGTPIADKVLTMETATAGSGIAWLRSYGFLTEDYYEYCQPRLESVRVSGHETVGFNQWDEEWESGDINVVNGAKRANSNRIRSKNFIPVIPDTTYYAKSTGYPNMTICFYDADQRWVSSVENEGYIGANNATFTIPSWCRYIMIYANGTTYNNDICINLSWDGERDGEYEPYVKRTYALDDSLTLRGIPKLDASNNLYFDGDIYPPSGGVTRKYGVITFNGASTENWNVTSGGTHYRAYITRDEWKQFAGSYSAICDTIICDSFASGTWNNVFDGKSVIGMTGKNLGFGIDALGITTDSDFKTWLASHPITVVYELATPTTETADPYQQTQFCDPDGTEQFVDYGVASGDRDVAIPAGHSTFYPEDLKEKLEGLPAIPDAPAADGTYTLQAVVSGGIPVITWVSV